MSIVTETMQYSLQNRMKDQSENVILINTQVWEMLLLVSYMRLSTSLVDTVATEEAAPMTRYRATIQISMNGASSPPVHIQVIKHCLSSTYNLCDTTLSV